MIRCAGASGRIHEATVIVMFMTGAYVDRVRTLRLIFGLSHAHERLCSSWSAYLLTFHGRAPQAHRSPICDVLHDAVACLWFAFFQIHLPAPWPRRRRNAGMDHLTTPVFRSGDFCSLTAKSKLMRSDEFKLLQDRLKLLAKAENNGNH